MPTYPETAPLIMKTATNACCTPRRQHRRQPEWPSRDQGGRHGIAEGDEACPRPRLLLAAGKFLPSTTRQPRAFTREQSHIRAARQGTLEGNWKQTITRHTRRAACLFIALRLLLGAHQLHAARTRGNLPVPVVDLHGDQVLYHGLGVLSKASNIHAGRQSSRSVRMQQKQEHETQHFKNRCHLLPSEKYLP